METSVRLLILQLLRHLNPWLIAELVPFPYSHVRSTHYSNRLHDFSVTIPKCHKEVYVNNFFSPTARLGNYLSEKCYSLLYDLNGLKSAVDFL